MCDGGESVEAITVDIHLKDMAVSVISAFGPLENAEAQKKKAFWEHLSEQAQHAKASGKGLILQGDLNSWLGSTILPGDQRPQNGNGKLFQKFLKENELICVNTLPLTKGLITRRRKYLDEIRDSTIDFYVVCQHVLPLIVSMEIFNHSENKAVSSDHVPLCMEVKLEAIPTKKQKIEIPNFQDIESQLKFKKATSETAVFTECFDSQQDVLFQCEKWMTLLTAQVKR